MKTEIQPLGKQTVETIRAVNLACQRRLRARRKSEGLNSEGHPLTDFGRKWGKLNVRALFKRMAEQYDITESAARMRHYRRSD